MERMSLPWPRGEEKSRRSNQRIESSMSELRSRTAPMAVNKVERLDEQKERA